MSKYYRFHDKNFLGNHKCTASHYIMHNHNKEKHNKTVCIFLGIYCKSHPCYEMLFRTKQVSCPLCTLRLHRHTVYPKTVCIFLGIYCILLQYRWCLWTSNRKSQLISCQERHYVSLIIHIFFTLNTYFRVNSADQNIYRIYRNFICIKFSLR